MTSEKKYFTAPINQDIKNKTIDSNTRIEWFDVGRVIAIILVVWTHCHEQAGWGDNIFSWSSYTIDRLGVPIFFMISGALMIPKAQKIPVLSFYRRRGRIPQFLFLLFLWTVLTNAEALCLTNHFNFGHSFHISLVAHNGITNNQFQAFHMWYMYAIIEIYLVLPFIARLIEKCSNIEIWILVGLMVLFFQFRNTLTTVLELPPENFLFKTGCDFLGPYVSYFIIGYLVTHRNNFLKSTWSSLLQISIIIVAVSFTIHYESLKGAGIGALNWYGDSLPILFESTALFILLSHLNGLKIPRLITFTSKCSFGIYLSHYFFIYFAKILLERFGLNLGPWYGSFYLLFFSFSAAFAFTAILIKVKYLKRLVM